MSKQYVDFPQIFHPEHITLGGNVSSNVAYISAQSGML